jgi:4-hydroxy-tetrahydrodipicolinate reductase
MKGVFINGATGKMGTEVFSLLENDKNFKASDSIKTADLIIDFSRPESTINILKTAVELNIPIIIGTTGFNKNELNQIKKASDHIPILLSYNLSTGIHKLKKILIKFLSDNNDLFDCKIIDSNSNNKIKSIDIDSFREGEFYGIHEIIFSNEKQIINFKHEALSRKIFAAGAVEQIDKIITKSPGLYDLNSIN